MGPLHRQKLLVQLHGAVPDHRPDRGGDEVREAGLVRVLAGHRVAGQLADVHRGTELEVAGPVRVRVFGTCGPGRRPDRIALVIHRQLPMRARHLQGGRVGRRVNGLRLLAAPHALRGALLQQQGQIQDVGSLPVPQASALANLLSRGAEPGLMLVLHLGDVEGLHNALQAPLLELGALGASQEPLDVLGLQSAEPSGRNLIEAREVARRLVIAELVEALRDLEGLGEHAPPRRGGAGFSSSSEDACSLTFAISSRRLCHLASSRVSRRASSKRAAAEGNLGIGSSFARSSQGLHLPSAHPLPCAWPG